MYCLSVCLSGLKINWDWVLSLSLICTGPPFQRTCTCRLTLSYSYTYPLNIHIHIIHIYAIHVLTHMHAYIHTYRQGVPTVSHSNNLLFFIQSLVAKTFSLKNWNEYEVSMYVYIHMHIRIQSLVARTFCLKSCNEYEVSIVMIDNELKRVWSVWRVNWNVFEVSFHDR
jgi:hypothetical protein